MRFLRKTLLTLTPREREALYFFCYQEMGYERSFFESILNQVDEIYYLKNQYNEFSACCAITYKKLNINNQVKLVIKTNLVCLSNDNRGGIFLETVGFRSILKAKLKHPMTSLYWVAVMVSPIAYLMMANSFYEYYPKRNQRSPDWTNHIANEISQGPFQKRYKDTLFKGHGLQSLRHFKFQTTLSNQNKQNYQFFLACNPGFRGGDGLITIVPINVRNLCHLVRKYIKKSCRVLKHKQGKSYIGENNGIS